MKTGTKLVMAAWLGSAVVVGGLLGALRLTAQLTPVRTGALAGPVAPAPVGSAEAPPPPLPEATESSAPSAPSAPSDAPAEIWTYRVSKKQYVVVDSYEDIPEEYRDSATRME